MDLGEGDGLGDEHDGRDEHGVVDFERVEERGVVVQALASSTHRVSLGDRQSTRVSLGDQESDGGAEHVTEREREAEGGDEEQRSRGDKQTRRSRGEEDEQERKKKEEEEEQGKERERREERGDGTCGRKVPSQLRSMLVVTNISPDSTAPTLE